MRRKKLIEPTLQLNLILTFVTIAIVMTLVQALVLTYTMTKFARELPNDGLLVQTELPRLVLTSVLIAVVMLVPVALGLGISRTHRLVGPLHRFRVFLNQVERGERPEACQIRRGDELHDFCDLLNRVTAPFARGGGDRSSGPAEPPGCV